MVFSRKCVFIWHSKLIFYTLRFKACLCILDLEHDYMRSPHYPTIFYFNGGEYFSYLDNLHFKPNTYYFSWDPMGAPNDTIFSPHHQTLVIPSVTQQVFNWHNILLITKHFVLPSGSQWVHKKVNFLPSPNTKEDHILVGIKIPKHIFFLETKRSVIRYNLNANWVIHQTLTDLSLFYGSIQLPAAVQWWAYLPCISSPLLNCMMVHSFLLVAPD
jgi:hypothetical protein